ncbi:MAG: glycosyltransferase family 39 protein [Tepidisphaeraceae bacterium]|jgi:hypothetical protein
MTTPPSISRPHPLKRGQCALLIFILLAGAFLRFYDIARASLWMDEIWSIEISTGRGSAHDRLPTGVIQKTPINLTSLENAPSSWHIWNSMNGVTHPPLYHLLLRWWMDAFSNSPAAARSLSAVLSLLSVLVFFDLCRHLHSPRIALLAAAIMALSPAQIEFAQEARSYPMLIFLCLLAAAALVRIEKFGPARARGLAVTLSIMAAALTHYFALGVIAALAIYSLLRNPRTLIPPFLAAALTLPWLWGPELYFQIHSLPPGGPGFLHSDDPNHPQQAALHMIGLTGQWLLGQKNAATLPPAALILLTAVAILWPLLRLPWRKDTLLWLLWLALTAGPLAISDIFHQSNFLEYLRYTILAAPAACALLASLDWPHRPLIRDTGAWCAIALAAIFAVARIHEGPPTKEDWRGLATQLNHEAAPGELLVFYGNDPWLSPGMWYTGFTYYAPHSPRPWLILNSPPDAPLMQQLNEYHSLWLIGRYPSQQGPTLLPGWQPTPDQWITTAGAACRMVRSPR